MFLTASLALNEGIVFFINIGHILPVIRALFRGGDLEEAVVSNLVKRLAPIAVKTPFFTV